MQTDLITFTLLCLPTAILLSGFVLWRIHKLTRLARKNKNVNTWKVKVGK